MAKRGLYLSGEFVPLTPKAYEILLVLVEEAGHVVTKDELLQRVWPDAHVEEGSISNQIFGLRKILNPHFEGEGPIATIARRGYRIVEPVRFRSALGEVAVESPTILAETPAPPVAVSPQRAPRYRTWGIVGIAAVLCVAGAVALALSWRRPASISNSFRACVVELPLQNLSQDSHVDWVATALRETLAADLSAGGRMRVVSDERVSQVPADSLGRGSLSHEQLRDVAGRLGCDLVLSGTYLAVGGKIRIDLRLEDARSGDTVASLTEADEQLKLVDLVSRAGEQLHSALRIPSSAAEQSQALRASAPANADAARLYFEGLRALRLRDGPRARELLTAAVSADPDYALAHAALSNTFRLLGYDGKGADEAQQALDRSQGFAREDRLNIEAQYYEATGNWEKAIGTYQALWRFFPDDVEYGLKLGNAQQFGGKSDDALRTVADMRKLPPPDGTDPRIDLLESTSAQTEGDLGRAFQAATRAADAAVASSSDLLLARARIKQGVDSYRSRPAEARTYFAQARVLFDKLGDAGGLADALRWDAGVLTNQRELEAAESELASALAISRRLDYIRLTFEILTAQSDVYRMQGNLAESWSVLGEAVALARKTGVKEELVNVLNQRGVVLKMKGDYSAARADFEEVSKLAQEMHASQHEARELSNLAWVDIDQGRLADARRELDQAISMKRRIGAKASLSLSLENLALVLEMQSDLKGADQTEQEECQIDESLGQKIVLAACRARLAEIRLAEGRAADAMELVKQVLASGAIQSMEPRDVARVVKVQLAAGDGKGAHDTLAQARTLLAKWSQSPEQTIAVAIAAGKVDTAAGNRHEAEAQLRDAIAQAVKYGLKPSELEARLALLDVAGPKNEHSERAALVAEAEKSECRLLAARARGLQR